MADTMNYPGHGTCIPEVTPGKTPVVSVLCVDDDPFLLDLCKLYLEQSPDISVAVAGSVEDALKRIETTPFDVIVSDYQMPGTNGIGFLKFLRENHCSVPFILYTGKGSEEVRDEAMGNGAMFFIQKSGHPRSQFAELGDKIREAFRRGMAGQDMQKIRLQYRTFFHHSGGCDHFPDRNLTVRQSPE